MKEKISVLIADDNQDFAYTLSNYINDQEDMEVIGIAKDGNEAVNLISTILMTACTIATIFSGYEYLKGGKDILKDIK